MPALNPSAQKFHPQEGKMISGTREPLQSREEEQEQQVHTVTSDERNLLYSLPGRTPQFSVLRFSQEAVLHCNVTSRALKHNSAAKEVLCHSTMNQSLSLILRAIRSAERLVCFGMGLFENYPNDKK
ncbi:hypothetical protein KUCAC02_022728 [Chaenocephalus aceratus]|uniref:Uncharacterized protein n=1 Tax=Chaenocephalus aceratus TaxID=36190 RepID=A0ACB9XMV4_CHAAC|nr:hypothetical protein KUCAC02_022728 [Chaenocephalus aceratus]